jgi:hypothetical protein
MSGSQTPAPPVRRNQQFEIRRRLRAKELACLVPFKISGISGSGSMYTGFIREGNMATPGIIAVSTKHLRDDDLFSPVA